MPDSPISIIDFHGLLDSTIPISPDGPDNYGPGPDMTTETWDGYYYHIKMDHLLKVTSAMNCGPETQVYPTHMDGVDGWVCQLWTGCDEGKVNFKSLVTKMEENKIIHILNKIIFILRRWSSAMLTMVTTTPSAQATLMGFRFSGTS